MKLNHLYLLMAVALTACAGSRQTDVNIVAVQAAAETTPMPTAGDAADDPAICINHRNPETSLIVGTNKKA